MDIFLRILSRPEFRYVNYTFSGKDIQYVKIGAYMIIPLSNKKIACSERWISGFKLHPLSS